MKALVVANQPSYQAKISFKDDNLTLDSNWIKVKTHYSSLNYKDALAITGKGKILRRFPLIPGIDACGIITETQSKNFSVGDKVVVTGCGFGEKYNGGFADYFLAHEDWVIPLPNDISLQQSMEIGTAGFTAALCVLRMEKNDQNPKLGNILINGASGGVGSWSTYFFSQKGYNVVAQTEKNSSFENLKTLGAYSVKTWQQLNLSDRPLNSVQFGGAVDYLGGEYLQRTLASVNLWGNVASVGMANSPILSTTVMPFILRGVSLLGISSTNCPYDLRIKAWDFINSIYKKNNGKVSIPLSFIELEQVIDISKQMLSRQTKGRFIIKFN